MSLCKEYRPFAWNTIDMSDIDSDFMYHNIVILPHAKPTMQRNRKLGEERHLVVEHEVT